MKELREIIASNIAALRTERRMTQFQLAEVLNYSDKAVSKWERGESIPDITVLKQIADHFGVTVDYLLCEDHDDYNTLKAKKAKVMSRNRVIITALAMGLVWLVATYAFLQMWLVGAKFPAWLSFIYALPLSTIVLLVFNSVWGNTKANYAIISVLVWVCLLSFHLTYLAAAHINVGLVYVLGVPAQVIIFLWSGLKRIK